MTKSEFLSLLSEGLSGRMAAGEISEHINFYREAIDDRMEEGLSDSIISDIIGESRPAKKEKKKRTFKAFEIILLILGSPLWLSLLICALAVIISLFAALWSVVISAWAIFASFTVCSLGGAFAGGSFIVDGSSVPGLAMIAFCIFLAGLSIFSFFGCRALTRGSAKISAKSFLGIKKFFTKKEEM